MDDADTGGGWQPRVAGGGVGRDAMTSHPPGLGRANHPWLAAAEQGCSALPRDIFGSQVSALRSQVRVFGFGYRCGVKFRS